MATTELTQAQLKVLRAIAERFPIADLDRLWIFDPQQGKTKETGLVVISLKADDRRGGETRGLVTVRYSAEQRKEGLHIEEVVTEEGWAPPESIDRVIAGVLARGGDSAGEPREERLEGMDGGWPELLYRLGQSG